LLRERFASWIVWPARIKCVLDLCIGSGCFVVVLVKTFLVAQVDVVDISCAALVVVRRNVATYHLLRRLRLLQVDLFSVLHGERYDLIIVNPFYVAICVMHELLCEYRYESRLALVGGSDGLDAVRVILR